MEKPKVLLVEDSPSLAEIYKQYLKNEAISLTHCNTGREALRIVEFSQPPLVILDLKLGDIPGEQILEYIQKNKLPCSVIVVTAHGSVDMAVKLIQLGAQDFLQKPIEAARLLTTVRNCIENVRLKKLVSQLSNEFQQNSYHGFIGSSPAMQGLYRLIESVSSSEAAVFVTGESGTGKEVCAETIHLRSRRAKGPFVALNCAAIPKDLMESEIFGHLKGSFTGANTERQGAASQADGGTLFLDEIGELSIELQTKLLRFIQSGTIKKVGGSKDEKVNVRFVCATNRDPLDEIEAGRFREDLYYRLNVLPLHLPPLRERGNDILLLANHFLTLYSQEENKHFERFGDAVSSTLCAYQWPGNVRQLQNVVRNIVVLHDAQEVDPSHLPAPLNQPCVAQKAAPITPSANIVATPATLTPAPTTPETIRPLAVVEREAIEIAINVCDGNIPKAAALLDVSPSTLYRKKQAWD